MRLPTRPLYTTLNGVSTRPHPRTPLPRAVVLNAPSVRLTALRTMSSSAFTTQANKKKSDSTSGSAGQKTEPDELKPPSVSLKDLGISRNVKVFLILVLGVFGSIETWLWCKAIWIWWKGKPAENAEDTK